MQQVEHATVDLTSVSGSHSQNVGMLQCCTRAGKVVPWVAVLVAKSDELSLISGRHMVEGEDPLLKVVSDPHSHGHPHIYTYT